MNKDYLKALYGGASTKTVSDQETREEYLARKAKKEKKKSKHGSVKEAQVTQQSTLKVRDADDYTPEDFVVSNFNVNGKPTNGSSNIKSRQRVDSESSLEGTRPSRVDSRGSQEDPRSRPRRQRVDSSSEDDDVRPTQPRPPKEETYDSDGDVVVDRSNRRRASSSSSEDQRESGNHSPEMDDDGDIILPRSRRMARSRSSSGSSSSSSSNLPEKTDESHIGLKTKEEFARIQIAKKSKIIEDDEYAMGKGQSTVYRDKRTGEIRDAPPKSQRDLEAENTLLNYELNMGALDKLIIKGLFKPSSLEARDLMEEQDPMAAFFKKETVVEELTATGKPKYKGRVLPSNRFNLLPGYRWDGVDRSNGFEIRLLRKRSEFAAKGS